MLKEAKKVVPDSSQAKHCLIHTTISRKKKKHHVDSENTSNFVGVGVCVCVCVLMFRNASVLTWVFDRLGEQERGWTKCESEQDGTNEGDGMVK